MRDPAPSATAKTLIFPPLTKQPGLGTELLLSQPIYLHNFSLELVVHFFNTWFVARSKIIFAFPLWYLSPSLESNPPFSWACFPSVLPSLHLPLFLLSAVSPAAEFLFERPRAGILWGVLMSSVQIFTSELGQVPFLAAGVWCTSSHPGLEVCSGAAQSCSTRLCSLLPVENLQNNKAQMLFPTTNPTLWKGNSPEMRICIQKQKNCHIIYTRFGFTSQCPAVKMIFWLSGLDFRSLQSGWAFWSAGFALGGAVGSPSPCSGLEWE